MDEEKQTEDTEEDSIVNDTDEEKCELEAKIIIDIFSNGFIKLSLAYPEGADDEISSKIATVLYLLNRGKLKTKLIQDLQKTADTDFVKHILHVWQTGELDSGLSPVITPKDTMKLLMNGKMNDT